MRNKESCILFWGKRKTPQSFLSLLQGREKEKFQDFYIVSIQYKKAPQVHRPGHMPKVYLQSA